MKTIGLCRLHSGLSLSQPGFKEDSDAFLSAIDPDGEFHFVSAVPDAFHIYYVESGGAENAFKRVYAQLGAPYVLLVHGERNSLAAALEILSFLHQKGLEGQILMGDPDDIHEALDQACYFYEKKKEMSFARLGVIGKPSDWLIASGVSKKALRKAFGIELVEIDIDEFYGLYKKHLIDDEKLLSKFGEKTRRLKDLRESLFIHSALKRLCQKYHLDGFTLRCFDLVKAHQETSCLAFGLLNDEGIIAACEGDVPALLTMYFIRLLTGKPSFQANPARFDFVKKQAVYAHCTCPFSMLSSYTLPTHFESGSGIAIAGKFKKKRITVAKVKADLSDIRVMGGSIIDNLSEANLCRSQIVVQFDEGLEPLVKDPYGNHMLFCYGDYADELKAFFDYCRA